MAVEGEIYECKKCGNIVAIIKAGGNSDIHCCGVAMKKRE